MKVIIAARLRVCMLPSDKLEIAAVGVNVIGAYVIPPYTAATQVAVTVIA